MSKRVRIEFVQPPQGLTEVIQQASGVVETAATKIAARADSISTTDTHYSVYVRQGRFAQDNAYGTSRPFGIIETDDEATYTDEAENKTLLKAVGQI